MNEHFLTHECSIFSWSILQKRIKIKNNTKSLHLKPIIRIIISIFFVGTSNLMDIVDCVSFLMSFGLRFSIMPINDNLLILLKQFGCLRLNSRMWVYCSGAVKLLQTSIGNYFAHIKSHELNVSFIDHSPQLLERQIYINTTLWIV